MPATSVDVKESQTKLADVQQGSSSEQKRLSVIKDEMEADVLPEIKPQPSNGVPVLRELTPAEAKKVIRADVSVISVFVNECLPGFKILAENEKIALFKTFLKNFLIIDASFWTAKYFPSVDDDRWVVPFSGYMKLDDISELFVSPNEQDSVENSKCFCQIHWIRNNLSRQRGLLLKLNGLRKATIFDDPVDEALCQSLL
ncbi:unnamed protein product [Enterobius vermicularis]|uniref:NR LBD domain-containing protein n=1 Tax=Enterobius vermicularis TaxID=51028 RepID=A0A0N4VPY4_ENTVE|nr:unnamed protein product [Enterobius vermicularis]